MNESELVRKCQKGHPRAQQRLFDTYSDRLYRLLLRYVKSTADAEDLIMEGFVKIFRNINGFTLRDNGGLEAWMRRIMVNEALMWLRRKHNLNLTESLDADNPDHDLEGFQNIEGEYLYAIILELPPGYRTVFNLYVIEGYDHSEIASMLEIGENTSRSQLFKAKQLLRKKIQKEGVRYGT